MLEEKPEKFLGMNQVFFILISLTWDINSIKNPLT